MELDLIFFLLFIIPSAIIHEYMHGWTADRLGDPTARLQGRLTLNPRAHVDPMGTFLLPLFLLLMTKGSFLFAYAKPVPYNPYNLKNQKWGPAAVAVAGPLSNLFTALFFSVILWFVPLINTTKAHLLRAVIDQRISLFEIASSPIEIFYGLLAIIVFANILLAVFNLVPIPPLDGSKLLYAVLPDSMWQVKGLLEKYGFILLIVFILFFFNLLWPVILNIFVLFTGGFGVF